MPEDFIPSRRAILLAATGASALWMAAPVRGQATWPNKPMRFIVGFPPGGNIDYLARHVANELGPRLGQSMVVENISGAGGNLATQAMLRAPADGHTLGFAAITMAANPAVMKNVGYDPLKDVTMVGQMSGVPVVVIVGAKTPYRSLSDLVEAAKARPGDVSIGHGGHGTSAFLAAALFASRAGIKFLYVPYRGAAPIMQDLLAGQIEGFFGVADASLPGMIAEGKIRILAVLQTKRVASLPGVPTAREQGFASSDLQSWHGMMVKAGTPQPVVERLHKELGAVIASPGLQEAMAKAGLEPRTSATPAEFEAFYRGELTRWQEVVKFSGLAPE